jgi:hypothetical protein
MTTPHAVATIADYLAWALAEGRLGTTSSPAAATLGLPPAHQAETVTLAGSYPARRGSAAAETRRPSALPHTREA